MNQRGILYSALLCISVHPKHLTIIWGGLSPTTTSVEHPLAHHTPAIGVEKRDEEPI